MASSTQVEGALEGVGVAVGATSAGEEGARGAEGAGAGAAGAKAPSKNRARAMFAAKVAVTVGALIFTFEVSHLRVTDLSSAMARLSASAVLLAIAVTLMNLTLAGFRWRVLLAAYGAPRPPSVAFLARAQLVGHFYNSFVPGNVTGDVVRAHATRGAFDGPLGSYMVVGIERFFGLAGLFTLGAVALMLRPLPGVRPEWFAGLALVAAVSIGLVPVVGRSVGRRLPGRIGRWAAGLPAVARPGLLGVVLVLSLLTHTLVAVTGHLLVDAIAPHVAASESLVLVPLAMAAMYVPFSIAGLGVREAAFVYLFGKVGVTVADATAASLSLMGVYLIVAAMGGVVHLLRPLRATSAAADRSG